MAALLVGREGALGAFEACGSGRTYSRASVHIAGTAWRVSATHFREIHDRSRELRDAVHRLVELQLMEAQQTIACNALHAVKGRLCKVLLELSDRTGSTRLPLTQDALAGLLGVQRTTITSAISSLQKSKFLRAGRGHVSWTDPERLETMACSCRTPLALARKEAYSSMPRASST